MRPLVWGLLGVALCGLNLLGYLLLRRPRRFAIAAPAEGAAATEGSVALLRWRLDRALLALKLPDPRNVHHPQARKELAELAGGPLLEELRGRVETLAAPIPLRVPPPRPAVADVLGMLLLGLLNVGLPILVLAWDAWRQPPQTLLNAGQIALLRDEKDHIGVDLISVREGPPGEVRLFLDGSQQVLRRTAWPSFPQPLLRNLVIDRTKGHWFQASIDLQSGDIGLSNPVWLPPLPQPPPPNLRPLPEQQPAANVLPGALKEDTDGKRLQAKEARINQPINDEINVSGNDAKDWKSYDLSRVPKGQSVTFELTWDESTVDLNLDVYDAVGRQVATSPENSGVAQKKLSFKVDFPERYYACIYATGKRDATVYTVLLRAAVYKVPQRSNVGATTTNSKVKTPQAAVFGKIVASFRQDDGTLLLYLNQGRKNNVHIGDEGIVLVGDSDQLLAGARFRITKLIDEDKAMAAMDYAKSLGKNKRFMIPTPTDEPQETWR